jgi:hypothetical protein
MLFGKKLTFGRGTTSSTTIAHELNSERRTPGGTSKTSANRDTQATSPLNQLRPNQIGTRVVLAIDLSVES